MKICQHRGGAPACALNIGTNEGKRLASRFGRLTPGKESGIDLTEKGLDMVAKRKIYDPVRNITIVIQLVL
jgi:hypothetical protein